MGYAEWSERYKKKLENEAKSTNKGTSESKSGNSDNNTSTQSGYERWSARYQKKQDTEKLDTLITDYQNSYTNNIENYANRFKSNSGDSYKKDYKDFYKTYNTYYAEQKSKASEITSLLDKYKDDYGEDYVSKVKKYIDDTSNDYSNVGNAAKSDFDFYSQFEDEADFNYYKLRQKQREEYQNMTDEELTAESEKLKQEKKEISASKAEEKSTTNRISDFLSTLSDSITGKHTSGVDISEDNSSHKNDTSEINSKINTLQRLMHEKELEEYNNLSDDLKSVLSEYAAAENEKEQNEVINTIGGIVSGFVGTDSGNVTTKNALNSSDKTSEALKKLKKFNLTDEETEKYLSLAKQVYNEEWMGDVNSDFSEYANKTPILQSIASVLVSPAKAVASLDMLKSSGDDSDTLDVNNPYYIFNNFVNTTRETVQDKVDWTPNTGIDLIDKDWFDELYSTVMSTGDSLVAAGLSAPFGSAGSAIGGSVIGVQSATDTAMDVAKNGGTKEQALLTGLVAGINETLWESLSIGNFNALKEKPILKNKVKDFTCNVLKSVGVNATEEFNTEVSNIVADYFINGDYSDYQTAYYMALAEGETESNAKLKAAKAMFDRAFDAGLGGALQGALMGGTGQVKTLLTQNKYTKAMDKTIKADEGYKQNLIDVALKLPENTTAYKLASNLNADSASSADMYELLSYATSAEAEAANDKSNISLVTNALTEQGLTQKVASKIANNVKSVTGGSWYVPEGLVDYVSAVAGYKSRYDGEIIIDSDVKKAVSNVLSNPNSTVITEISENLTNLRKAVNSFTDNFEKAKESKKSKKTENSVNQEAEQISEETSTAEPETVNEEKLVEMLNSENVTPETSQSQTYDIQQSDIASVKINKGNFGVESVIVTDKSGNKINLDRNTELFNKFESVSRYGYGEESLNKIIELSNKYGVDFANVTAEVEAGHMGLSDSYDVQARSIPESGKREMRDYGREQRAKKEAARKKAKITLERGIDLSKLNDDVIETMSPRAKAWVDYAGALAEATGNRIVLFESTTVTDENGEKHNVVNAEIQKLLNLPNNQAVKGAVNMANGVIYIDVNGKGKAGDLYAYTLAHEYVHEIRRRSDTAFRKLSDFIVEKETENGVNVREQIRERMEVSGKEFDIEFEEYIAESCEEMLLSKDFQKRFYELNEADKGLAQRFIRLLKKMKAAFKKLYEQCKDRDEYGLSSEALEMRKLSKDTYRQACKLYAEALAAVSTEYAKEQEAEKAEQKEAVAENATTTGEVKCQIEYTVDNIPVAVIDKDILQGVPEKDWVSTVKNTMSGKFKNGIPISGRLIKVTKISRSEFTNSKYSKYLKSSDGTVYADKYKSANNLDDIILASTNYVNESLKHTRNDNIKEFARGDVLIRVGNNDYKAKVIIGFTNGGNMLLYDIIDFDKTTFKIKRRTPQSAMQNAGSQRNEMPSNDSISNSTEKVNKNFTDSTGKNLTNAQQEYFKDSKVRDENGNLLVVYHGTSNEFNVFGKENEYNKPFYFTESKEYAEAYANKIKYKPNYIKECYLNITNPLKVGVTDAFSNWILDNDGKPTKETKELLKAVNWDEDYLIDYFLAGDNRQIYSLINSSEFAIALRDNGYDGVVGTENGSKMFAALNSNQIKLTDNENPTDSPDIRYQDDIKYLELAKDPKKNEAQLQAMVDEAAKEAGYKNLVYHGSESYSEIKRFKTPSYFTSDKKIAKTYATEGTDNVYNVFLKTDNFYELDCKGDPNRYVDVPIDLWEYMDFEFQPYKDKYTGKIKNGTTQTNNIVYAAEKAGYSGIIFYDIGDNGLNNREFIVNDLGFNQMVSLDNSDVYVAFSPSQIKSADPVTYDDDGNIIPLSERFNEEKTDIRYQDGDSGFAKKIKREYSTGIKSSEIVETIENIRQINEDFNLSAEERRTAAKEYAGMLANKIVKSQVVADDTKTAIKEQLKGTSITLNNEQREEVISVYGSVKAFADTLFGARIYVKNSGGVLLEDLWETLNKINADHFKADENTGNMPIRLSDALNATTVAKAELEELMAESFTTSMLEYVEENPSEVYSISQVRLDYDNPNLSRREILANALYNASGTLKEAEQINRYKQKINTLNNYESQIEKNKDELRNKGISKERRSYLLEENKKLNAEILSIDKELLSASALAPVKELMVKERERAVRVALQNSKAKDNLRKEILRVSKWLNDPRKSEMPCPDFLKKPIADVVYSLAHNSSNRKISDQLTALSQILNQQAKEGSEAVPVSESFYLTEDFTEKMEKLADEIKRLSESAKNTLGVEKLTDNQALYMIEVLKQLKHAAQNVDELHSNEVYKHVDEISRITIKDLGERASKKYKDGVNAVTEKLASAWNTTTDYLYWDLANPVYAFKRLGSSGETIFKELQDGQDKYTKLVNEIDNYISSLNELGWTAKNIKNWEKEKHEIKLSNGKTVTMTTAGIMSFYALSRREQGLSHLKAGGVLSVAGNNTYEAELSFDDIIKINNTLTKEQMRLVETVQNYLSSDIAAWGNEISQKRYLVDLFKEKNYFPIKVVSTELSVSDHKAEENSLWRLVNMGFTKKIIPQAGHKVEIVSFFDVAVNHMNDMAKYNAFSLPMIDTMKWLNYREVEVLPDSEGASNEVTYGVRKSLDEAFGKNTATTYILELVRDLNGSTSNYAGPEKIAKKLVQNAKVAAVAANARVALLQPTAYVRASRIISMKSLTKGLSGATPAQLKNLNEMAMKYAPIAQWKSYGFYDINVSNTIEKQLKGNETVKDKINDVALKAAEYGDKYTWSLLFKACMYEAQEKYGLKFMSEECKVKAGEILEEVVYKTQVVDSILTRCPAIRSKNMMAQELTAFMSEPILSYNILLDTVSDVDIDYKKLMKKYPERSNAENYKKAVGKNLGNIGGALLTYTLTNVFTALAEAAIDALRDDDDKPYGKKYFDEFKINLINDMSPINKIPVIKSAWDLFMYAIGEGYETSGSLATQYLKDMMNFVKIYNKIQQGSGYTGYALIKAASKILSDVSGLPISSGLRECVTVYNAVVSMLGMDDMKVLSYERSDDENGYLYLTALQSENQKNIDRIIKKLGGEDEANKTIKNYIRTAYKANELTRDEAEEYYKKYISDSRQDMYWDFKSWDYAVENGSSDGYSKFNSVYDAVESGNVSSSMLTDYYDHTERKEDETDEEFNSRVKRNIAGAITSKYKDQYIDMSESERASLKQKLINAYVAVGYTSSEATEKIEKWIEK